MATTPEAARPIVDHESPAEKLAELLAQLTHHDVERRAGAGPTQQPHRSRGIGVCRAVGDAASSATPPQQ